MYKEYSPEVLDQIENTIKAYREKTDKSLCAAFDADGTLWDTDVQDIVFESQIEHPYFDLPENPLAYQKELNKKDPVASYLWLAQILKGQKLETVLKKNEEAFKAWEEKNGKLPLFPAQQKLISFLQEQGVEVYIVTASVKWSVHYGAAYYNIPDENVLGVKTKVENGIITDVQDGPVTYRPGKAEAIKEVTKGKELILTAGNTMGDFELLSTSKEVAIAVRAAGKEEELFETEEELNQQAEKAGWFTHKFR